LEIEEIYKELEKVIEPTSGEDIVKLGIVSKIIKENNKFLIFLSLARRTPWSPFEMAMNWTVHAKIVKEIVKVLEEKIADFEIYDDMTLQRYYPIKGV
jgi:metal-sulfur cluster biosynthetic enzyme